ncbi:alpha/beta fold hydrolase [Mycobacterium sp. Aquia_213]|uniref:alpha/beta fold hydrolase n=1 Tax=Mycobacterium sp. Aquia_213 TaxID=2991728 RepID=UPI0022718854|nr:alpha/beta fold hydrolase [Mycobacterium sp. Aquia_213]WAC92956.1 alpha/beta fold hydrolase [Mycobacterium sp. Aquia_213]
MTKFVFAHGSWHGSWCWERVRPILVGAGHEVATVDLPSGDPSADVMDYVAAIEKSIEPPLNSVVLVAHSSAGIAASVAARRMALRELVLVAAFLPQRGVSVLERIAGGEPMLVDAWAQVFAGMPRDEFGGTALTAAIAEEFFYQDCPADDVSSTVLPHLTVERATKLFSEPIPLPEERLTPSRYVVCTADQALSPEWAREAAGQFCDEVVEIDAGHSPFWSKPAELCQLLTAATR